MPAGASRSRIAEAIAAVAWLSEAPSARLNDSVTATYWLWWLTASGVRPGWKLATAGSGAIDSGAVETALAEDEELEPVAASAACEAVETACAALDAPELVEAGVLEPVCSVE